MNICKICLCSDPANDLSQLISSENEHHSGEYILLFCLGIQVIQDSVRSTKLCGRCFTKLAEFHQFKSLAIKNEATLSSFGLQKYIENAQNTPYCTGENGIKCEFLSQANDDNFYDEPLIDYPELEKKPLHQEIFVGERSKYDEVLIEIVNEPQELSNNETSKKTISQNKESSKTQEPLKPTAACHVHKKQFHLKYSLDNHLLKPNKPRRFECAHCNKLFISKNTLERHVVTNHSDTVSGKVLTQKKFQCSLCTKSYHNWNTLQKHKTTVHAGYKPECPICKKCFSEKYMQYHIKTKHESDTLQYKCEKCDKKFANKTLLERHVSVHTGVKPFSCDLCDAKFRLKYSVALHKAQVHEKSKNYVCHICSKRYFTGSLLQRHIREQCKPVNNDYCKPKTEKAEAIMKVKCPDCGKPLASERSMKIHRALHKGLKEHCQICGLAFATHKYVLNHMKTHTQKRQFACSYCEATYIRSSARRRHELKVHIRAGEKKSPTVSRKNRRRKKEVTGEEHAPNLPTDDRCQDLARLPIFPISEPFKTEDE